MKKQSKNTETISNGVLQYRIPEGIELRTTPLANIGEGGVNFLSPNRIKEGTNLNLEFMLEGESEPVRGQGAVIWCSAARADKDLYDVGVKFIEVSSTDKERIRRHTKEQYRKKAGLKLAEMADPKEAVSVQKVAHEMRARVAVIRGAVDNVVDGVFGEINEEQKKSLLLALNGADRLSEMIEELMSVYTGDRDVKLNVEKTALTPLIERVVDGMAPMAYKEGVALRTEIARRLPQVFCDPAKIEQVLLNLLRNSLKFTSRGGWVKVSAHERRESVEISIADNGVGIPESKLNQLFDGERVVGELARRGGHRTSGLGLIIVREILDAHGIEIHVQSEIGKGSKFIFCLPREKSDRV